MTRPMSVRFPESVHEGLRTHAEQIGLSMNDVVVMAVSDRLAERARRAEIDAIAERAMIVYADLFERLGR